MDTSKIEEVFKIQEEILKERPKMLKEIEADLINPTMPVAQKVHEIMEYLNDIHNSNENLYRVAKELYKKTK